MLKCWIRDPALGLDLTSATTGTCKWPDKDRRCFDIAGGVAKLSRIRLRDGTLGLRRDLGSSVPREMDFLRPKGERDYHSNRLIICVFDLKIR